MSVLAQYSYDDTRVLEAPNAYDPTLAPGNRLFLRPLNSAELILNAAIRKMNWNVTGYFVGRTTDSDFLGLGYTYNPGYVVVEYRHVAADSAQPHRPSAAWKIFSTGITSTRWAIRLWEQTSGRE